MKKIITSVTAKELFLFLILIKSSKQCLYISSKMTES